MRTIKELARRFGHSEKFLIELCEQGKPPAQEIDDVWVMWEDDVAKALNRPPPLPMLDDDACD